MTDLEKIPLQYESVHWSQIQTPCLREIPVNVLIDELVYRNQKVLFKEESVKIHVRHPEIVVYDRSYIGFLLMEAIAPILSSKYGNFNECTNATISDTDFLAQVIELFANSYWDLIKNYEQVVDNARHVGVELDCNANTILRTYKNLISSRDRITKF
jgi:hypothetical protein